MRSNKFRVTWSHNVAIVGPKKRCTWIGPVEATLIGDIWWTVGDTGTNYNEFELFSHSNNCECCKISEKLCVIKEASCSFCAKFLYIQKECIHCITETQVKYKCLWTFYWGTGSVHTIGTFATQSYQTISVLVQYITTR